MNATKTNLDPLNLPTLLTTLSRAELNSLASALNIAKGKSKSNTIQNVATAITEGKVRIKTSVAISIPPDAKSLALNPFARGRELFSKKFRNYTENTPILPTPPALVE